MELAQNLVRENIQRSQQNMKEYYDCNASQPPCEIGQRVWVYTPRTKKGLSKKLLRNWFGPYRIVEQSSPVRYRLRSKRNKKVTFAVHAQTFLQTLSNLASHITITATRELQWKITRVRKFVRVARCPRSTKGGKSVRN